MTKPKGLNAGESLSLDSPFSVELALIVTLVVVVDNGLLLQQLVVEETERFRVGENTAENTILGWNCCKTERASTVQVEHNILNKTGHCFCFCFLFPPFDAS